MSDFQESLGFEDENLESDFVDCFKGERGKTDRFSIVHFEEEAKTFLEKLKARGIPEDKIKEDIKKRIKKGTMEQFEKDGTAYFRYIKWVSAHFHYDENSKKSFICLDPTRRDKICCKKLGQPGQRNVTVLAVYRTDKDGKALEPVSVDVKPWRVGKGKVEQLKRKDAKFPLIKHDIEFPCVDTQYQKADIDIFPNETPLWRDNPELTKKVQDKAARLWPMLGVNYIGQKLSEEEVRTLLLGESHSNNQDSISNNSSSKEDVNVSDVLDSF